MTCDVCETEVQPVRHEYRIGVIRHPEPPPAWIVIAPIYYAASPDGRRAIANFCGAICGLKWIDNPQTRAGQCGSGVGSGE